MKNTMSEIKDTELNRRKTKGEGKKVKGIHLEFNADWWRPRNFERMGHMEKKIQEVKFIQKKNLKKRASYIKQVYHRNNRK